MATVREQLTQARDLIQQQRHDEARSLLVNIEHPKAYEWLEQLDARFPMKKQAARNRGAALPPPADPFASVAERTPERTDTKPKAAVAADASITSVTVILGGLIAMVVVLVIMLMIDNAIGIHTYFMSDPRRIVTATAGFAMVSTFVMGAIARLIGGAHHILIGIYYAVLNLVLLAGWHYGSYHLHWGDGLASMLSPDGFTAYSSFVSALPFDLLVGYGFGILVALSAAITFGTASGEELRQRFIEGKK